LISIQFPSQYFGANRTRNEVVVVSAKEAKVELKSTSDVTRIEVFS